MAIHSEGINPTDDERSLEQQEEQRHGDRGADHEEEQTNDRAATRRLGVAGSHASSMPQATSDGKRVISHTPTDDEREALLRDLYTLRGWSGGDVVRRIDIVDRAMAALSRPAAPEPGARLDLKFREELVEYSKHRIAEAWGDPIDGADAETLARQIVGAQEWMWLARGFPIESTEIPEPQAEPSDAQLQAAAEAFSLAPFSNDEDGVLAPLRAALRAAGFRRSEVPEPGAERPSSDVLTMEQVKWDYQTLARHEQGKSAWVSGAEFDECLALHDAEVRETLTCPACGVPRHLIQHDEGCDVREPQGEPSDAQVDAAWAVIGGHRVLRETVRAALRAAGGVR